jgi:hypothetical protein
MKNIWEGRLFMALSDSEMPSTSPGFYSKLPTSSPQSQPPKTNPGDHMGVPVKPIKQPIPTSGGSAGMPYSDYDY